MHHDQFDDLARDVANDASRWQILTKFLAVTTGGILALGARKTRKQTKAAGMHKVYLPLIAAPTCPIASTCEQKHYCSDDSTCRCIKSAEGPIRCGLPPGCESRRCATSADCAVLGEGSFCDTPNSGCCGDSEQSRCIGPCRLPGDPCPPTRVCGSPEICCPEGTACFKGVCVASGVGTWDGTTTFNGDSVGVRFVFQIDKRDITGRMYAVDPVTKVFLDGGPVRGYMNEIGTLAYWDAGVFDLIEGLFVGNTCTGAMNFPGSQQGRDFGFETFTAELKLSRTAVDAGSAIAAVAVEVY